MKDRNFNRREQRELFGEVRPIVSADFRGKKFVAVGSTFYADSKWKVVPDFLHSYLRGKLGIEWAKAELSKPLNDRHQVLQWVHSIAEHRKAAPHIGENLISLSSGYCRAYFLLAYDLYTLDHHSVLQDLLVSRLRKPDQFQGARYELFIAATFIRAGFEVKHDDERDGQTKHPEFVATHRITKLEIDIEVKSKHRDSVLGYQQLRAKKGDKPFSGVPRMLKSAGEKFRNRPYMIFIDLNLPPPDSIEEAATRRENFHAILQSSRSLFENGKSKFNIVGFTNYPDHYDGAGAARCGDSYCLFPSLAPLHPIPMEHAALIETAIQQYGNVPTEFTSQ